jgi:hypothetical protein
MSNAVVYSDLLKVRCQPEIVERVNHAATAKLMKPSEYVRRAVIDRLAQDGMLDHPTGASPA